MTDRILEYILETESDEYRVEQAINKYLKERKSEHSLQKNCSQKEVKPNE